MRDGVMVSVTVVTYNHKEYIGECLDSILAQKTHYSYEIIVHDDASTDGTKEILMEYERRYGDVLRVLYEENNQYSQGVDIVSDNILPHIRGRYVANCDGDDYWNDVFKLQKQVDYMLSHPDIIACTTNAIIKNYKTGESNIGFDEKHNRYLTPKDVLSADFTITKPSAWLIRAKDYIEDRELIKRFGGYYDLSVQFWMLTKSNIYFMNEAMITYRYMVAGSWSAVNSVGHDASFRVYECKDLFNEVTCYKWDKFLQNSRRKGTYRDLWGKREYDLMKKIGIRRCIGARCFDVAISLTVYKFFPKLFLLIKQRQT